MLFVRFVDILGRKNFLIISGDQQTEVFIFLISVDEQVLVAVYLWTGTLMLVSVFDLV